MKEKTNDDYARQINAYWGRDVVCVVPRTEHWTTKDGGNASLTYRAITSDVGPWFNGFPPK